MSFDPFNIKPEAGVMTRGEVLGHAAAEVVSQLLAKGMPPEEVGRLCLIAVVGSYKALRLGPVHKAVSDLRELWEQVNPTLQDPNNKIEIS